MDNTDAIVKLIPDVAYEKLGENVPYALFCIMIIGLLIIFIVIFMCMLMHIHNKDIALIREAYESTNNYKKDGENRKNKKGK